jgi:hypothetical protein
LGLQRHGRVAVVIEAQVDSSEERRASVFISYSREDKDFVRRLDAALTKRDRETWVDLEDIRPTEEWLVPTTRLECGRRRQGKKSRS